MSKFTVEGSDSTAQTTASPLPTIARPIPPNVPVETVSALVTIGGMIELSEVWQNLLRETVFPASEIADRMDRRLFQERLMSDLGQKLMMIVWKDSGHVCDGAIDAAGAERVGSEHTPINCHNLAKRIAIDKHDVDKQEKRIQGIVKAAEAYGLIKREQVKKSRQQALRGTERLHRLMLDLNAEARPICADIATSGPGGL
jgi:hypothetical protein